jgi:signal peptidase I
MEPQSMNDQKTPREVKKEPFFSDIIKFTLFAILIVVPIRTFVAQPFIVSGASMDPTFWDGEYLIVDELSFRLEEPKRGEVLIFRYPDDPSKFFIKRLIGLPGETLTVTGDNVHIKTADGKEFDLKEPYVEESRRQNLDNITTSLGAEEYFVMGDNRIGSSDSRRWGPVPRKLIVGRPLIRLIPPSKIALFPGDHSGDK